MINIFMDMDALNYNKVMPLKDMVDPDPRAIYEELVNSKAQELFLKRHREYQVGVWYLDGVYYLVQSIKGSLTPDGRIYHNTIYMLQNDAVAIAKCIDKAQKPMHQSIKKQTAQFFQEVVENGERSN